METFTKVFFGENRQIIDEHTAVLSELLQLTIDTEAVVRGSPPTGAHFGFTALENI